MNGIKIVLPAATLKEAVEAKLREMVSVAENMEVRVAFMGRGNDIFVEANIVPEGTPDEPARSTSTTATGAPRKKPGPKPGSKRKTTTAGQSSGTTPEPTPEPARDPATDETDVLRTTVEKTPAPTEEETLTVEEAPAPQRSSLFGNLTRPDNRDTAVSEA